jgi:hypothetical protein
MNFRFSQINAIGKKLNEMVQGETQESLFRSLFAKSRAASTYETVHILATDLDFMRADVFLEDLAELAGGLTLSMDQLISLLYEDFLFKVRETKDLASVFKALKRMKEELSYKNRYQDLFPGDENRLILRNKFTLEKARLLKLQVRIRRKSALRGEVFLMDIRQFDSFFHMTLEELMSLLLINMVDHVRKGEQSVIVRDILQHFSESD